MYLVDNSPTLAVLLIDCDSPTLTILLMDCNSPTLGLLFINCYFSALSFFQLSGFQLPGGIFWHHYFYIFGALISALRPSPLGPIRSVFPNHLGAVKVKLSLLKPKETFNAQTWKIYGMTVRR